MEFISVIDKNNDRDQRNSWKIKKLNREIHWGYLLNKIWICQRFYKQNNQNKYTTARFKSQSKDSNLSGFTI
jgi:hypothetical protein